MQQTHLPVNAGNTMRLLRGFYRALDVGILVSRWPLCIRYRMGFDFEIGRLNQARDVNDVVCIFMHQLGQKKVPWQHTYKLYIIDGPC